MAFLNTGQNLYILQLVTAQGAEILGQGLFLMPVTGKQLEQVPKTA